MQLCTGLIRIVTHDFKVVMSADLKSSEVKEASSDGRDSPLREKETWVRTVRIGTLPTWTTGPRVIETPGGVIFILSMEPLGSLADMISTVQGILDKPREVNCEYPQIMQCVYLTLSSVVVITFDIIKRVLDARTEVVALANGFDKPSKRAIELLQIASPGAPAKVSLVQEIPLELQDMILSHVTDNDLESARIGSLLDIGRFNWKVKGRHLQPNPPKIMQSGDRALEIWFDDDYSGLSYYQANEASV